MSQFPGTLVLSRRSLVGCGVLLAAMASSIPRAAARQATPQSPSSPLIVAASTPIFADLVANVGGERTEVWSVIPPGADPHTWEASPQAMVRLTESDTFIFMGAYLEPFIESGAWRRTARDAGITTLELATYLDLIDVDRVVDHGDHVHDLRGGDPHVWLDPLKTIVVVDVISAHLTAIDPAGAATYAANAEAYNTTLIALDAAFMATVERIPPERRKLVVAHDAYTYFAARYGFEVVGVVLPSPDGEPSAREFVDLVETIHSSGVDVIFAEPQFDSAVVEQLAAEAGVEVGLLMTDTFSDDVNTYLELMEFNRSSLERHLGA